MTAMRRTPPAAAAPPAPTVSTATRLSLIVLLLILLASTTSTVSAVKSETTDEFDTGLVPPPPLRRRTQGNRDSFRGQKESRLMTLSEEPSAMPSVNELFSPQPGDLGVRFNKIVFEPGATVPDQHGDVQNIIDHYLPLGPSDFPMAPSTASWLRYSEVHSLVIDDNCFDCPMNIRTLVAKLGAMPDHPNQDPNHPYWAELLHVVRVQQQRLLDVHPNTLMPLPTLWENYTCTDVAEAVHDEVPGTNHIPLLEQFMAEGATVDTTIIEPFSKGAFLRGIVALADANTWAPSVVGPMNFGVKYFGGRARPEEVVYRIQQENLTPLHGVPRELERIIRRELPRYETAPEFTAYPEGCPPHPSWPAMHSAASSASLWMPVLMNLTPEQECQARLMDYAVAYARTVAGVHYPSDNWAGLTIGQELIANFLPDYLEAKYGSDPDVVREKIAMKRFDWTDFETSSCALHGTIDENAVMNQDTTGEEQGDGDEAETDPMETIP